MNSITRHTLRLTCTLLVLFLSMQAAILSASLSDAPLQVVSSKSSVFIEVRPERDAPRFDSTVQIVAIPQGSYRAKLKSLSLVGIQTITELKITDSEALVAILDSAQKRKAISVQELGYWRNVRLLAIHTKLDQKIPYDKKPYLVKKFEMEIEFDASPDSVPTKLPTQVREFLESVVVNPDQVSQFATTSIQPTNLDHDKPYSSQFPAEWDEEVAHAIRTSADSVVAIDRRWVASSDWKDQGLSPSDLIVWSRGAEVKTFVIGDADRSFSRGGRLSFLAQRNDSEYTNERVYYIGKRKVPRTFPEAEFVTEDSTGESLSIFRRQLKIEKDHELQTKLGNFLAVEKMTWVWSGINPVEKTEWEFDLPSLAYPVKGGTLTLDLYQAGGGVNGEALFNITLNNQVVERQVSVTNRIEHLEVQIPDGVLKSYGNQLSLRPLSGLSSITNRSLYLDSITAEFDSFFRGEDGQFQATLSEEQAFTHFAPINFRNLQLVAFDVQDKENPRKLSVKSDRQESLVSGDFQKGTELLLLEADRISRAPIGEKLSRYSSTKTTLQERIQGHAKLIISHERFLDSAEKLAKETGGTVIDSREIYHAYNGGELSPVAIRHFLRDAVMQSNVSDVVLFGDCTKDGQRVSKNDALNFIPTMNLTADKRGGQDPFASDAYYTWLIGDDEIADIFLGRISVNSVEDAEAVVDKIIRYKKQPAADYSNRAYFISDGGTFTDTTKLLLEQSTTEHYVVEQLSTDDVIWEDNFYLPDGLNIRSIQKVSPVATNRIAEAFNKGQGLIHYMGHGSPNIWSNQRIWFGGDSENSDNTRLTNKNQLPFLLSYTCNNGAIDYPLPQWNVTIIEDMMRVKNGGIVGAIVPSGPGFSAHHYWMSKGAMRGIDSVPNVTFGKISEAGRLYYQAIFGDTNHSRMFLLLGDPSLELKTPSKSHTPKIVETNQTGFVFQNAELDATTNELAIAFEKKENGSSTVQLQVEALLHDDQPVQRIDVELNANETYQTVRLPIDQADSVIGLTILNSKSTTARKNRDYQMLVFEKNPGKWADDAPALWVSTSLLSSLRKNQGPRLSIVYRGEQKDGFQLKSITTLDGEVVTRNLPTSSDSGYLTQEINLPLMPDHDYSKPIKVELISSPRDESEPVKLAEQFVTITGEKVSDLIFEKDSVSIYPKHPVDGASVFMRGRVKNIGKGFSHSTTVELYSGDQNLRPFAVHPRSKIPSLESGESAPFEVRWDADKVRELSELSAVIDHENLLIEKDTANNRYTVPINVRSKWKLLPAGIRLEKSTEPGIMDFTATIANIGDSDAQRVTVVFFSSDEQTEEFQLGEILVDLIPASSHQDVHFNWDIREFDPNHQIQPSYYIALKGSMQRISSVTGEQ